MKKEKIWVAGLIAFVMTLILLSGFVTRIQYETNSRYAFVSSDMSNLKANGKNTAEALAQLKDAGSRVVTVEPLTVKGLKETGRLELISYSSLSINDDAISQQIRAALEGYTMPEDGLIAIVTDLSLAEYMSTELSYRYQTYTNRVLEDGQTTIFAFQNLNQENDLIVGYDYLELDLIERSGQKAAIIYPSYTFEHPVYPKYFKEFFNSNNVAFLILRNNPYDNKLPLSEEMEAVLRTMDFTLVLWENENQISNEKPFLYKPLYQNLKYNAVRGFHMDKILDYDHTLYRYRYYQWFNSALERNTVFIHTNLLSNPSVGAEENFNLTLKAISDFTTSLKGYEFGDTRENIPYSYPVNTMAMAGGILALSLLALYLMVILKKLPPYFAEGYFVIMIAMVILSYAAAEKLTAIYALLIMVVSVSLITALLFYLAQKDNRKKLFLIPASVIGILVSSVIGICALLGGIDFYTSTQLFYGVKLSLLLPILLTALNGYLLYYRETVPPKQLPKTLWNRIKTVNQWIFLPVGIVALLFLTYYLIRTGKSNLILPMEDNFRKWLTDVFYIRPRLKEFLFGYPMFALFLYASFQKTKTEWKFLCGVCATVLFTSVLNTFCHTFTAVTVSLLRVANGLLCGVIVSAVLVGAILLIQYLIHREKKPKTPKLKKEEKPVTEQTEKPKQPKNKKTSQTPTQPKKSKKKKHKK